MRKPAADQLLPENRMNLATDLVRKGRRALAKSDQLAIFRRDGWMCRWCRKPVIFAPVMRLMQLELRRFDESIEVAYHHAHWTRQHSPLLDELGAVIDHVDAFSTGGPDNIDNLVTACNKCNAHKSAALA